jgi:hypothetical protein
VQALQIPIAILTTSPDSPGCRALLGCRQPADCRSATCLNKPSKAVKSGDQNLNKRMRYNGKMHLQVISVHRIPHYKGKKRDHVQALQNIHCDTSSCNSFTRKARTPAFNKQRMTNANILI